MKIQFNKDNSIKVLEVERAVPEIHPEGRFVGELVDVGEPRESSFKPGQYHMSLKFQTAHGFVWGFVIVYLGYLQIVRHALNKCIGDNFNMKIRHRVHNDHKYVSVDVLSPFDS